MASSTLPALHLFIVYTISIYSRHESSQAPRGEKKEAKTTSEDDPSIKCLSVAIEMAKLSHNENAAAARIGTGEQPALPVVF